VTKAGEIAGVKELVAEIAARFEPEKIIPFGSRAYGTPTEESDLDLLVIMRTRKPLHAAAEMVGTGSGCPWTSSS